MSSEALYVDKKRTHSLLRTMGLHGPIELLRSGFIGSISYKGQNVNISGEKFSDIFSKKSQHSVEESTNQQTSDGTDDGASRTSPPTEDTESKRKARQRQAAMAGEAWEASRANREGNLTMIEELRELCRRPGRT